MNGPSETKPNPENCKNCSSKCAYNCAQLQYTIQHRTVQIIFPLTSRQPSQLWCLLEEKGQIMYLSKCCIVWSTVMMRDVALTVLSDLFCFLWLVHTAITWQLVLSCPCSQCDLNWRQSRLSATDNFERVLSSLEMRCEPSLVLFLSCPCAWCELAITQSICLTADVQDECQIYSSIMTTHIVSHTQQSSFTFLITSSQAHNGPLVLVHTASLLTVFH